MLSNFFTNLGWSRDDAKWIWGQIVSAAAAIASGVFDLPYWASYVGVHLSTTGVHVITVLAVAVLWLSGKMATSNLFGLYNVPASSGGLVDKIAKSVPIVLFAILLAGTAAPGCASGRPPAGTYAPDVTRTFNADQLTKDLIAAGQTARNLNATAGAEHLSDQDTVYIRDFSLISGAALYAWGQGATTLQAASAALDTLPAGYLPPAYLVPARAAFDKAVADHGAGASALFVVVDIYKTLRANVSVDATKNPKLTALLGSIDAGIAAIPIQ